MSGKRGQAFHVVAPSLPGFGFSEAPSRTGYGAHKIADLLDALMQALGYPRYLAQGEAAAGGCPAGCHRAGGAWC